MQKLEAGGVIARREHSPDGLARFAAAVSAMPEVTEAYSMASEVDYMLRVAVEDIAEFDTPFAVP